VHETPRPIREINEEIPDWLCEIVSKLMEKDPERRFQSAEELQDLITRHLTHLQQPDRVPQPGPISSEVRPAGDSNATVTQRQSSVETLLAFWMTPQRGYARFVSIPCLILLGVWISVFLGAVVADADEATQVVLFLAGFTGLPLAFTILTLFWSRSPARLGPETEKSVSVVADVPFTVMERVLSCGMTPQPGFIRRVSVPCLILLGVLLITFVVSVALDPVQYVRWWSHVLTASLIGIAILFMVLTALWARSRARPGLPMPVVALTVMGMTVCLPLARVSYLVFQGRASSESNDSRPEMYSTNDGVSARDESSAIAVELTMHQWYSRSLAETTIESSVLRAGFSRLYIDYLVSTGQDVSGEAEFEEKLSRMIDGLRSISPQFLCVSPEQETAFATEGLNAVVDFTRRPEDGHHYMLATLAEARSGFLPLTSFAVANSSDRRRTLLETHALAQLLAVEIERSKFATGLRSEPIEKPGPQEGEELTASKVLRNGFDRILEGFPTKNGPDQSLEKVKVSEIKLLQRIAQLRDVYPAFLNTSAQQERRFELGEFDEVSTLQSIRKTLQTLEDFGVELHPLTVYVVEQYRADGYRGVQLEVTKHLLDFERANLKKNLK
jgi:hypothetical protein